MEVTTDPPVSPPPAAFLASCEAPPMTPTPVIPLVDGVDWGLTEPIEGFVISLGICRYIAGSVGISHIHIRVVKEESQQP